MIVCRDCGQRNTDRDTFCGACGRFLEWTGERVAEKESPVLAEARAELVAPKKAWWRRTLDTMLGGPVDIEGREIDLTAEPGAAGSAGAKKGAVAAPAAAPKKAAPPPPPPPAKKKVGPPPPPTKKKTVAPPPGKTAAPAKAGSPAPPPGKSGSPAPPPGKADSSAKSGSPAPPAKSGSPAPPPGKADPPARSGAPAPPGKADSPAKSGSSVPPPAKSGSSASSAKAASAGDAAALVVPVEAAVEPDELPPTAAAVPARPKHRAAPTRKLRPGELICGECGEGNQPTRKFCARCGEALTNAERVRVPWWRRFRRRPAKVLKAGARPGRGGRGRKVTRTVFRRVRRYAFVVVLLFGLAAGFYPPLRTYVTQKFADLRQDVAGVVEQTMSPARPVGVTASAESPDHGGRLAFDQFANTYWAAPYVQNGLPSLTVDLGKPTTLARVIITSGAAADYTTKHRPSIVNLAYSNEKSDTFTLADTPKPQEFTLRNGLAAQTVRIQVLDVYPAEGGTEVAMAEIEFFSLT